MIYFRLKFILVCAFVCCQGLFAVELHEAKYVLIADDSLLVYKEVVTGAAIACDENLEEIILPEEDAAKEALIKRVMFLKPKAILTLGPKSTFYVKSKITNIPIVLALVPRQLLSDISQENVWGVRLEFSYQEELEKIKSLAPNVRRIGVLYDPSVSEKSFVEAKQVGRLIGLSLLGIEINDPTKTKEALQMSEEQIDALWFLADKTVLNIDTTQAALNFSLAKKKPFFAINEQVVKNGALVSFSVDFVRVGKQMIKIAREISSFKVPFGGERYFAPEGLGIALNLKTAKLIDLASQRAWELMSFAAKNNYTISVYE